MPSSKPPSLATLLDANHPLLTVQPDDEPGFLRYLAETLKSRKRSAWTWSATRGLRRGVPGSKPERADTEHPAAALTHLLDCELKPDTLVLLDIAEHLPDPVLARLLKDTLYDTEARDASLVFVGDPAKLPADLRAIATSYEPPLPDDQDLEALVKRLASQSKKTRRTKVRVTRRALNVMVRNLRGLSLPQAERVIAEAIAEGQALTDEDTNTMLAAKRRLLHADGLLEYVQTPLNLSDIAGIRHLKRWLHDRRDAFSEDAEAFGLNPPRGVLMLGVPGSGKSLCAKAIAASWERPLLRLDPGALFDRYIGESEHRLRTALQQAEAMSPVVLWIDEIEKGFASASSRSNDGGTSQRMFGSLLTWMQDHTAPVFLVATANNIDALPPELLRKGRFDELFFVDLPSPAVRKAIFSIHLAKRKLDPKQFDLKQLAAASDGYTGAEIEAAITSALFAAFPSRTKPNTDAIATALRTSPPLSVTMAERLANLRHWAKTRTVPAD
ncbi:MAG: AAA family ATPase [Planctomycetota bacterium]